MPDGIIMNKEKILPILIIFVTILTFLLLSVYWFQFSNGFNLGTTTNFAEFGSYLGGSLGPILSFATLIIVIQTLKLQLKEISDSKQQSLRNEIINLLSDMRRFLYSDSQKIHYLIEAQPHPTIMSITFSELLNLPLPKQHIEVVQMDETTHQYINKFSGRNNVVVPRDWLEAIDCTRGTLLR